MATVGEKTVKSVSHSTTQVKAQLVSIETGHQTLKCSGTVGGIDFRMRMRTSGLLPDGRFLRAPTGGDRKGASLARTRIR